MRARMAVRTRRTIANEPAAVTKLMIDRPSDFKFHVTENMKQML